MKAQKIFLFLVIFWLGMLVGVSFFSAPVKFLAPSLTKAVALEIGDLSFKYFNYIEWFLCLAIAFSFFCCQKLVQGRLLLFLLGSLMVVLLVDSFCLLPDLHQYVVVFTQQNETIDIALQHRLYVIGDSYKALALSAMAVLLS